MDSEKKYYKIGEVAEKLGVTISSIRYYDNMGLLVSCERSEGGARLFDDIDIEWLKMLTVLKQACVPLSEIRKYIEYFKEGDASLQKRYDLFDAQLKQLNEKIKSLQIAHEILEFKCWYYKTAIEKGGSNEMLNVDPQDFPPKMYARNKKYNILSVTEPLSKKADLQRRIKEIKIRD